MGRIARGSVLYDGCYAHVFTRAIEKRRVLKGEEDFKKLKRLIKQSKKKYKFCVHHYCLMSTHFHLVVRMENVGEFSKAMGFIKKTYSEWYNVKNKRFGPMWRDRYKSLLIEDENYLYACGLYVEQNPVKAGMVNEAAEWKHSSSRYYQVGGEDELVNGYELPELPDDVDLTRDGDFTRGLGVGSGYFKYQLKGKI